MKVERSSESTSWRDRSFAESQRMRRPMRLKAIRRCLATALPALVLLLLLSPPLLLAQDFIVEKHQSNISIHRDSSLEVVESLTVVFSRARHGIYREIPYRYIDELGKTVLTPMTVSSVTDGTGRSWKYRVQRQGNVVHIRIGDPDAYVSGRQTYIIAYTVQNALLFLQDHDELYWNVTGNYWKAPIEEAKAFVSLDGVENSKPALTACYTGFQGSRESACGMQKSASGSSFFTTRKLDAGEGLTISFGWPKGVVTPPPTWRKLLWSLDFGQNWVFLLPFASLLFMFRLWATRGRDPSVRQAVTVSYGPPRRPERELTSAETGALLDERLDPRDVTAAIVGLAVKGFIKIEEKIDKGWIFDSTDYVLSKLKAPDPTLTHFEKLLLDKVFADGSGSVLTSDMKNKFYKHLDALTSAIFDDLVSLKYFAQSPERVRKSYLIAGVIVAVGLALAFAVFSGDGPHGILAAILTGATIMLFSRFMPAKTTDGALAHSQILGFQEFLNRAEKDRLQRMEDKNLFSKFLPYAIALDVAENWCKAFEGIYQEPPQWYVSSRPGSFTTFSPRSFSAPLGAMTSSLATAIFSAPRGSGGSGGSGGGSSGGGFGGGGGGSW